MKKEQRQIGKIVLRCLRLRCPVCGQSSIFRRRFHVRHHCPSCLALFQREDGFFVGAIVVNIITTELLIILLYGICLLFISSRYQLMLSILFVFGIVFPVAFYHHSWSVWLSFDHLVETLPKHIEPPAGLAKKAQNN
ncbi:MAG: hypothetical protein ICV68_10640 [Pyrinomonadaceae bacterium]|nr:hypothetical protein [Pyrinomonadaceae bacterium]